MINIFNKEAPFVSCEAVLHSMGCRKSDPSYPEYVRAFEEIEDDAIGCLRLEARYTYGKLPPEFPKSHKLYGKQLIFFLITAGHKITEYADEHFANGRYMKGMMANAIADSCLFSYENEVLCAIKEECKKQNKGIRSMLDAPDGIPPEFNTLILSRLNAREDLGVEVNKAYVFTPLKTYACIMELSENTEEMNIFHDCNRCAKRDECTYRSIK